MKTLKNLTLGSAVLSFAFLANISPAVQYKKPKMGFEPTAN